MASEEQVCVIYAGVKGFLDNIKTSEISKFESGYIKFLRTNHSKLLGDIRTTGKLTPEQDAQLASILRAYIPTAGLLTK